jgi:hypothetical protein
MDESEKNIGLKWWYEVSLNSRQITNFTEELASRERI